MKLEITNSPVIETERLILRVPRIEDFDRYAEAFADDSSHFIGGPLTRGDAWRRFLQVPGAWLLQGFGMFSIIDKSSGQWLGQAGPWKPDGWPGNEVGYSFHPDARGKGHATEACTAAIDWAFDTLGWSDVIHCIDPANTGSQGVAKRLGSQVRGPGKLPPPLDVHPVEMWGQSREQWFARRPRG
ncbi:GNAT family N-acetyltransferase [Novilysobacter erysipheiresistens]|uniref:GNAT family N-acetyltransferase n=1 Tax=Novilysobacter erysipheiresistens TaxID=1749332 RepID=A0ABU7Z0Z4_9GAMM